MPEKQKSSVKNILIIIFLIFFLLAVIYIIFTYYLKINKPLGADYFEQEQARSPVITEIDLESLAKEEFHDLEVYNEYGDWEYTEQSGATPTNQNRPQAPQEVRVVDTKKGKELIIYWEAPAELKKAKVNIYRSKKAGERGEKIDQQPMTKGYYKEVNLKNNTTYYYALHTVTAAGKESSNLNQTKGIPTDLIPTAQPANLVITNTGEGGILELIWDNPLEEDFDHVNIYRSSEKGVLGKLIASVDQEKYTDKKLTDNQTYYYTLGAVDTSGNESSLTLLTTVSGNESPFKE